VGCRNLRLGCFGGQPEPVRAITLRRQVRSGHRAGPAGSRGRAAGLAEVTRPGGMTGTRTWSGNHRNPASAGSSVTPRAARSPGWLFDHYVARWFSWVAARRSAVSPPGRDRRRHAQSMAAGTGSSAAAAAVHRARGGRL